MSQPDPTPTVPGLGAPAEPLLSVGAVTSGATAVIALLVSFGLHLSHDQQAAIMAAIAVLVPLLTAIIGRGRVFSPATVRKMFGHQP